MFNVILWASDGSEHADRALDSVRELAEAGSARVLAVHVKEITVGRAGGYPVQVDEEEVEHKIQAQVHDLKDAGLNASYEQLGATAGGAAHAIADAAKDAGADLIVVGTRGVPGPRRPTRVARVVGNRKPSAPGRSMDGRSWDRTSDLPRVKRVPNRGAHVRASCAPVSASSERSLAVSSGTARAVRNLLARSPNPPSEAVWAQSSGGGGIRTHEAPLGAQRFSRPPLSTAQAPRRPEG